MCRFGEFISRRGGLAFSSTRATLLWHRIARPPNSGADSVVGNRSGERSDTHKDSEQILVRAYNIGYTLASAHKYNPRFYLVRRGIQNVDHRLHILENTRARKTENGREFAGMNEMPVTRRDGRKAPQKCAAYEGRIISRYKTYDRE